MDECGGARQAFCVKDIVRFDFRDAVEECVVRFAEGGVRRMLLGACGVQRASLEYAAYACALTLSARRRWSRIARLRSVVVSFLAGAAYKAAHPAARS